MSNVNTVSLEVAPEELIRKGGCRLQEMTPENTGRDRACLACDLPPELPAPAWPVTGSGLIRSLSASRRDTSQCCRGE